MHVAAYGRKGGRLSRLAREGPSSRLRYQLRFFRRCAPRKLRCGATAQVARTTPPMRGVCGVAGVCVLLKQRKLPPQLLRDQNFVDVKKKALLAH